MDFDNEMPTSLRVFLTWLDAAEFVLTNEKMLWSYILVFFFRFFRPFGVAKLISVFLLFKNVLECWLGPS